MKKTNILIKTLLLCFLFVSISNQAQNSQQVTNGDFELDVNNSNYSVIYGFGFEIGCNTSDFSEYTSLSHIYTNDLIDPATLIELENPLNINDSSNYDPQLFPGVQLPKTHNSSVHSLKLNRSNEHNCGNCQTADSAVLEKLLLNTTEDYLSLNFAMVFSKPAKTSKHVIARFEILDSSGNILETDCIESDDLLVRQASGDLKYIEWTCKTLDISGLKRSKKGGKLRVIVSDFDKGNDTIMYLDNIGNDGELCEPIEPCLDGNISMNQVSVNCPSRPFIVSGDYTLPTCDATNPTNIVLNLVSFNPSTGNSGTPVTIAQSDFSNGSYSFSVSPSTLNLNESLEYNLVAIANFSDGSSWSVSNPGSEITFINCDGNGGIECNDYWVAILDEYIDGTQGGSDYVYLMANGNYPSGATYNWTTTRQSGLTQSYSGGDTILVSASINDRIVSATVTVSYEECTETVSKTFACAIPNTDANGNTFPECNGNGGGFGKKAESIKVSPNPIKAGSSIKIQGLESYDVNAIEVVDMFGNIKSSQKTKADSIRLGNLNTGIYFIKISTKQGIIQKKIIVK